MDLYAHILIETLDDVAKANNIDVSRLRGYRLMGIESPAENIEENAEGIAFYRVERLFDMEFYNGRPSGWTLFSKKNEDKKSYYLDRVTYTTRSGLPSTSYIQRVRWDRVHGKLRKLIKFTIKQAKKTYIEQFTLWNKFVGREDVLYIHSRIGKEYTRYKDEPWYLGGCVDYFDSTYCDIYAKIDPNSYNLEELKNVNSKRFGGQSDYDEQNQEENSGT